METNRCIWYLTFGNTNGFYLDFEDSSDLGNDANGGTWVHFAETNLAATDQSTDTCTNNFCTPLIPLNIQLVILHFSRR